MFYILLLLFVSLFVFRIVCGNRVERSVAFFIAVNLILTSLYVFVDVLSGNGFDEAVVYHLIYGLQGAGFLAFVPYIAAVIFVISLLVFLAFYLSSSKLNSKRTVDSRFFTIVVLAGLSICFLKNPLVVGIWDQLPVLKAAMSQSDQVEEEVGRFKNTRLGRLVVNEIPGELAFDSREFSGSIQKNIIWIYAESLERTYFNEEVFGDLLANLSIHAESARRYTSVSQPWGTGWTIGGIVGSQCGLPLVTLGAKNVNSLANVRNFMPGAFCLGDVLKNRGYTLEFVGGASAEFAGKGNFLRSHGFSTVWDRASLSEKYDDGSYKRNQWGYYDDFTLAVLKDRALELHGQERPFFLNGLTLDTHSPDGFVSPSCASNPALKDTGHIDAAIRCSDVLLASFISWFKSSELYDDTLLVLSSDHLTMPNSLYHELSRLSDDRKLLFWLFGKDLSSGAIDKNVATFDLGATVLGHALPQKDISIGLGRNIEEVDSLYNDEFSNNDLRAAVTGLQAFAWREAAAAKTLLLNAEQNTFSLGSQTYPFPALIGVRDGKYSGISWIERERRERFVDLIDSDSSYVWVDVCGWSNDESFSGSAESCAHLVNNGEIVDSIFLGDGVVKIDIERVLETYRSSSITHGLIIEKDYAISNSGSNGAGGILGAKSLRAGRGVNFFEKPNRHEGWKLIKNVDLCADSSSSAMADHVISELPNFSAIVVDDSAHCGNIETLQRLGSAIGLKHLGSLKFRQPYIAILKPGKSPSEYVGSVGSSTVVSLPES